MEKLIIYPDVFIWEKGNDVIIYNSRSFKSHVFKPAHPDLAALCRLLNDPDNLYEIPIDRDCAGDAIDDFVEIVVSERFGDIVDRNAPTISLPPLLNIQSQMKKNYGEIEEDVMLEYFTDLTIYPGGGETDHPDYFRQTCFPISSRTQLPNGLIIDFLKRSKTPYLRNIKLVVSHVGGYLYELIDFLESYGVNTVIYMSEDDMSAILAVKNRINSPDKHVRLVRSGCAEPDGFYDGLEDFGFNFLIRSEREYEKYESDIERYGIHDFSFIPVYDNNPEFFENNVFLTEDDIKSSRLSKRRIFMNQSVNSNFWGSFTLMPDGKIYSDVNKPAVGSLEDNIYTLIGREMRENHSWRYIRTHKPCSDCLYQWLCPSPSSYEIVIGRPNLCFVK